MKDFSTPALKRTYFYLILLMAVFSSYYFQTISNYEEMAFKKKLELTALEIGLSVKGIMLYSSKKTGQKEFEDKTYPYLKNGIAKIQITNDKKQIIAQVWANDFDSLKKYPQYSYPLSRLFNTLESKEEMHASDDLSFSPYYENSELIIYYDEQYPINSLISSKTPILYLMTLVFIAIISYFIIYKINRKYVDKPLSEMNKCLSSDTLPSYKITTYKQTYSLFSTLIKRKKIIEENEFKISFLSILISSARCQISTAIKSLSFGKIGTIYDPKKDCLNKLAKTEQMLNTGDNFSTNIIGKSSIRINSIFRLGFNDDIAEKIILDLIKNISPRNKISTYNISSINGHFSIPSISLLDTNDMQLLIINSNNIPVSSFKECTSEHSNLAIFKILIIGEETIRPIWDNYSKENKLDSHYISTPIDPIQIIEQIFLNIQNSNNYAQTKIESKNVVKFNKKIKPLI